MSRSRVRVGVSMDSDAVRLISVLERREFFFKLQMFYFAWERDCIVTVVVARFSFVGCSMLCTSGFADEHLAVESYTVIMLLTFILRPVINSISSPLTLSFQSLNLSYLQILSTVVFPYFRTDSMDSADCLPILLSISDFFTFFVFHLLVVGSVR